MLLEEVEYEVDVGEGVASFNEVAEDVVFTQCGDDVVIVTFGFAGLIIGDEARLFQGYNVRLNGARH